MSRRNLSIARQAVPLPGLYDRSTVAAMPPLTPQAAGVVPVTAPAAREAFWEDLGRPDDADFDLIRLGSDFK